MVESYSVLKKTLFSNLTKWNVSELISNNIIGKYKNQPLVNYLVRSKNAIEIKDDELYKQITIHQFGEGVSLRCEKYGRDIKTKRQFVAKKGQFIISRIDARNGSFGIVPDFLDGAIVTNDFWLFDIKNAEPQFLVLLLLSQKINSFWQSKSNGTTNRQRVDFKDFIESALPIPPLDEQRKIIRKYQETVSQAENLETQAEEKEKEIDVYLFQMLGIREIPFERKRNVILNATSFSDLYNWDVKHAALSVNPQTLLKSNVYKNIPIKIVFAINPLTQIPKDLGEISFLPMECISDIYGEIIEKRTIDSETKGYTKFKENDVIFAKITPCMQNGKCAVVKDLKQGFGMGSTEFHVFRAITEDAKTEYLHALLRTKMLRKAAMNYFTGSSGQQRVSSEFIENLYIPLPPLSVQEEIVNHINQIKSQVKELRSKAAKLRQSAKTDFERSVFE